MINVTVIVESTALATPGIIQLRRLSPHIKPTASALSDRIVMQRLQRDHHAYLCGPD